MTDKMIKSDIEWKSVLTPEQYDVLRMKGTEPPGSGKYDQELSKGMYRCGACGAPLFSSETKYDAGCGWPSFTTPVDSSAVELKEDRSAGMGRTEVTCAKCGSHLGHMFDALPADRQAVLGPNARRFCINSLSLNLEKKA